MWSMKPCEENLSSIKLTDSGKDMIFFQHKHLKKLYSLAGMAMQNSSAFESAFFSLQVPFENKIGRNVVSVSAWNCCKISFLKLLPIQSSMYNTVTAGFLKSRNNFNVLSELCSFAFLLGYLTHFQSNLITGFYLLEVFVS